MRLNASLNVRKKPTILLVIQGPHHLSLFHELFACCTQFHWVCALDDPSAIPKKIVSYLYKVYGVQFFTDTRTALSSFLGIDVVLTTFAVPHRVHSRYLQYIAAAYEIGIPVYELQHGLFQLGISYSEESEFVGSGIPGALTGLAAPNLTKRKFVWGEAKSENEVSIGYPPFVPEIFDSPAYNRINTDTVLVATNLHWNVFNESDVKNIWNCLYTAFNNLPDVNFILMPHPGELRSSAASKRLSECEARFSRHVRIFRPDSRTEFIKTLSTCKLVISTISTVLLDFEMYKVPCILLHSSSQRSFINSFRSVSIPSCSEELVHMIKEVFYKDKDCIFESGYLKKFQPKNIVMDIFSRGYSTSKDFDTAVPIITKYIQGVK